MNTISECECLSEDLHFCSGVAIRFKSFLAIYFLGCRSNLRFVLGGEFDTGFNFIEGRRGDDSNRDYEVNKLSWANSTKVMDSECTLMKTNITRIHGVNFMTLSPLEDHEHQGEQLQYDLPALQITSGFSARLSSAQKSWVVSPAHDALTDITPMALREDPR